MSDLQGRISARQTPDTSANKGHHYDFIKSKIHTAFQTASVKRVQELSATPLGLQEWYSTASSTQHNALQAANIDLWTSQNQIDRLLDDLQGVYEFAEPLLSAALKEQYGVDDDVTTTYLHLYLPKDRPWYTFNITGGVVTRSVSLLDAALHNFAASETYEADSDFISKPDERGLFDIKPIKSKMTIAQFQTLCRELDIGARYTKHLESLLLAGDAVAKAFLKYKVTESQKAAFKAAAHLALMTKDIIRDSQELILAMLDGQRNLTLKGKVVQFAELSILDAALTGIVLITPDLEQSRNVERLIAYVPNDPEHPLKEYASGTDFLNELTRQLRDNAFIESSQMTYRQYFSQFVDQQQRGHFFAGLQQRLFEVQWHKKEALDQRPTWREEPVTNPRLQFSVAPITGDFWTHLYQQKLNKILNDARAIAVSTADTDSNARWAWWDNFKKIVSDIFNAALMVVTPFVPGLGELMMAYTAYQITYDLIESIVDLAEGLWVEAAEHFVGVVTDIVQLATFAAGGQIGQVARLKLSSFVDGMKPVELPDGQTRLWNPDLKPYEQPNLKLPADSSPNELGLHSHEGQDILPVDGKHYAVQKDPKTGNHRIKHPNRPGAYSPELKHNGLGAWTHEAENPRTWEGPTLMQRLGHSVKGLSDAELEQIRTVSGTEDNALRKMHVENSPPPPLLADALKRFKIDTEAGRASTQIRQGTPLDPSWYWFESLAPHLEGWPSDKALKVYEATNKTGNFRQYGKVGAPEDHTLTTSLSHVLSGKFPESIVDFLDEKELETLLGKKVPKDEQVQALRDRLADEAEKDKADIFKQLYQFREKSDNPPIQLLQRTFPELPSDVAEQLLSSASNSERGRMNQEQRLPLRLKTLAREAAFEARTSHAYEGFHDEAYLVPDAERLALNSLRIHTDTFNDLRIEVREGSPEGPLRCSVGGEDAPTVRLLVRNEFAKYEVHGGDHPSREGVDFFQAILQALPADKRTALGYRVNEGQPLKQWVMAKTAPPAERRTILAEPPIRTRADRETMTLLQRPMLGAFSRLLGRRPPSLEDRVKSLYPSLTEEESREFVQNVDSPEGLKILGDLEAEKKALVEDLDTWVKSPTLGLPGSRLQAEERLTRTRISNILRECWEKPAKGYEDEFGDRRFGSKLDLRGQPLYRHLRGLPQLRADFSHVTSLDLMDTGLSDEEAGFLKNFPNLRSLDLTGNPLASFPQAVNDMPRLTFLGLAENPIEWSEQSLAQLKELKYMKVLILAGNNRLKIAPDISHMPDLQALVLSKTGIKDWPVGLFEHPRPPDFLLDLQNTSIKHVPEVTPGSPEAETVARTRLDRNKLSLDDEERMVNYRQAAGLDPYRTYDPRGENGSTFWMQGLNAEQRTARQEIWDDLEHEHGSQGFFEVIKSLEEPDAFETEQDGMLYRQNRAELTQKVWRMLIAIDQDEALRNKLFTQANSPHNCADAGAQIFNSMGVDTLVFEAYRDSTPEGLEVLLVTLAKQKSRLNQVNNIAKAEVKRRISPEAEGGDGLRLSTDMLNGNPGTVDEVEVFTAFQTALKARLDLPWLSEHMTYRVTGDVNSAMIDEAYNTVMALEFGDGLVDQMIEQSFWEAYLHETYPNEFKENERLYESKAQLLDELRIAQKDWAHSDGLPDAQKNLRKETLKDLANKLPVPESVVFTGEEMTDVVYTRLYRDLGHDEQELSRRLTRAALRKAGH
ncbi:NEL-type E3 ubiquitin ligase domain-containing protein [Pseudomonas fluorescens]|uniref:RING-type E3 ubiquitin transferase n=1 Tax=Pseudomonas fluorescens TaxID=294 RepID=A0A5E7A3J0_PSEFL|nr:NEL-type E3 ubiquitin ligase domain-containing protein [Pseudomonas fluorescens]VVN70487.1 hypothetical protein PS691_00380 [Pseudomonas fluorescens]